MGSHAADSPDSSCCRIAGPFGYEAEHCSTSRSIGTEYREKPPHPVAKLETSLA